MRFFQLVLLGCALTVTAQADQKPNIAVFLADDLGWGDVGCYGGEALTPNLDKLAEQGLRFTQSYSASGVCSPSRSAILTGRTPYRNGVWRHLSGNHEAHLRTSEITYPEVARNQGYATCHVGKWHLLSRQQWEDPRFPLPKVHGYNFWMATHNNASPSHKNPDNFYRNGKPVGPLEGYSAPLVAKEANRWLEKIRSKEKPFLLSVWFHEPHSPIATDKRFTDPYGDHENRVYLGNVSQLDFAVGEVMKTLESEGVADDTLVIFTSDNGPVDRFGGTSGGLRGGKRSDYEGGIRVPGIMRWPGRITPGTESDTPIIGTDLFSTVLDILDVPLPSDRTIDGVSLLPVFEGKSIERTTPLFWRTHVSPPGDRVAMRIGDWKIVGNDTLTKFQLFHVQEDWKEENDLAASEPEKLEEMKQQLLKVWNDIEKEGPNEWWENEKQKPSRGGTLNY